MRPFVSFKAKPPGVCSTATKHLLEQSPTTSRLKAHMRRNVIKRLHSVNSSLRDQFIDDFETLQLSSDSTIFAKASKLFIKKYTKKSPEMIEYMNELWFSTHANWFEGIADKLPTTNNALESFNLVFKKEETLGERMPLGRFMNQCILSASRWSKQYSIDKVIATSPSFELPDWTAAYHWAKSDKQVNSKQVNNLTEFYCPPGELTSVTEEDIKRVIKKQWSSFDLFASRAFAVWIVRMDGTNWMDAQCTCPCYLKQFKCKHILGLAIRLKYVKPPPAVRQVPIGQKRKRGRPKKATKALIID